MSRKTTSAGIGKKVLASALSAAMVVAFAPVTAQAETRAEQGSTTGAAVAAPSGASAAALPAAAAADEDNSVVVTLPSGVTAESFTAKSVTYFNGSYYSSLKDAVAAANADQSVAQTDPAVIYCKPGAALPDGTHIHCCTSVRIYGNGAYLTSGENDLEVDTFGAGAANDASDLARDISIYARDLGNLGVWGQRQTEHKIDIELVNCDTKTGEGISAPRQRVYLNGDAGETNLKMVGCDIASDTPCTAKLYCGNAEFDKCTFTGVSEPISMKIKRGGSNITVRNTRFVDCGLGTGEGASNDSEWAAPIRVANQTSDSASVSLSVENCSFEYSGSNAPCNGDVLIGDGRANEQNGQVKATFEGTNANIQVQRSGYYAADGTTNAALRKDYAVSAAESAQTVCSHPVAVGDTAYASLAEAVAAAPAGSTVTLLADTALDQTVSIDKELTIDLAGKTITGNGVRALQVAAHGNLTLTGKGTVTTSGDLAVDSSVIRVGSTDDGAAALTVGENVTVDAPSSYGITAFGKTNEMVIIDGTVKSEAPANNAYDGCAIATLGSDDTSALIMLAKTARVVAANTNAVYLPSGKLYVHGATVEGATGIYVKSGFTSIDGGTIKGTGAKKAYESYDNGGVSTGDALVVDSCGYPGGAPEVVVTGGAFESANAAAAASYFSSPASGAVTAFISGGTFASDVAALMAAGSVEYAMHGGGAFVVQAKGADAPANTPGYYWGDADASGVISEVVIPDTPVTPPAPDPAPDPTPDPTPDPAPAAPGTSVTGTDASGNTVAATVTGNEKTTLPDGTQAAGSVEFNGVQAASGSGPAASVASVDIPSTVTAGGLTYVVTRIADEAFANQAQLKRVTIPATVVEIGKRAFAGTSLASVKLPAATTTIGAGVFKGCAKLKSVDIARAALTQIPADAFSGTAIRSIALPASVTAIGARAFKGTALKTLTTGPKLKVIGSKALTGAKKLATLTVTSKKLTKNGVRGSLKGSSVKKVVVAVAGSKKTVGKYVAKYAKIFKKANSGKSVKVVAAKRK